MGVAKRRNLNRLFSAFDPDLNDDADIRQIGAALRLMWKPSERVSNKLKAVFSLFESESCADHAEAGDLVELLSMCALTKTDLEEMAQEIRRSSLPYRDSADSKRMISRREFSDALRSNQRSLLNTFRRHFLSCLPEDVRSEVSRCVS